MVGTRRVSYHEPEAEGVSSSQNSSQNTISEITPAASTGSQTRTISQWTPDQQEQLFRAELAGKELDNRLKEAQLRRLEVEAAVGLSPATVNPAHAPGLSPALSQSQEIGKNDPPEVTSVSQLHPGVSRDLIRKIFDNQFYPDRLSKLRPCHGTEHITDSAIRWEGGDLKVGPTKGDHKDFGKDCWIWSEGFQIYISIYSQFWAPKFPNLTTSMISFHRRILRLSQIYIWQGGVLKLALERHMDILHNGHTDAELWKDIPSEWEHQYLTPQMQLGVATSLKRTLPAVSNTKYDEICTNFNKGSCRWKTSCYRRHECSECGATDHAKLNCKK